MFWQAPTSRALLRSISEAAEPMEGIGLLRFVGARKVFLTSLASQWLNSEVRGRAICLSQQSRTRMRPDLDELHVMQPGEAGKGSPESPEEVVRQLAGVLRPHIRLIVIDTLEEVQ